MEHLPQIASDACELMPCQLEWCQVQYRGWEFWSKIQDDELNYQLRDSRMMAGAPVVFSSTMPKQRIKSIMAKMSDVVTFVVQFWAPIKVNGSTFLSTADQPFAFSGLLDKRLFEYRKLCLDTLIPIDVYNEDLLGPPGRVFQSGLLEYNSDVGSYSEGEFPLLENAIRLGICSYCAIPVFNLHDHQCLGVFEIASTDTCLNFRGPMEDLESSGLYIRYPIDLFSRPLQPGEEAALDLITMIEMGLNILPFAQIWVPCSQSRSLKALVCAGSSGFDLFSYDELNNVSECCFIMSGKALVGRAFSSQGSCFCKDVTLLSLKEYPMVPSA
ncbi:protein NLP7-like isoform X2 [Lycium barbarum]|uniref:protein NLP7-like isoform X2 n=1 Tax=Lycium barbarum TaxID=112863 RepID=UPI00293F1B7C|nr:protein NLP7-like isoform X2 [Lycium barbarum]